MKRDFRDYGGVVSCIRGIKRFSNKFHRVNVSIGATYEGAFSGVKVYSANTFRRKILITGIAFNADGGVHRLIYRVKGECLAQGPTHNAFLGDSYHRLSDINVFSLCQNALC